MMVHLHSNMTIQLIQYKKILELTNQPAECCLVMGNFNAIYLVHGKKGGRIKLA